MKSVWSNSENKQASHDDQSSVHRNCPVVGTTLIGWNHYDTFMTSAYSVNRTQGDNPSFFESQ